MLVSVSIGARELGLSVEHLRNMIKAGRFPSYKLGPRATRVDVDEIKNLGKLSTEGKSESPQGLSDKGKQDGGSI